MYFFPLNMSLKQKQVLFAQLWTAEETFIILPWMFVLLDASIILSSSIFVNKKFPAIKEQKKHKIYNNKKQTNQYTIWTFSFSFNTDLMVVSTAKREKWYSNFSYPIMSHMLPFKYQIILNGSRYWLLSHSPCQIKPCPQCLWLKKGFGDQN